MKNISIIFCLSIFNLTLYSQVPPIPQNPNMSRESRGEVEAKRRRDYHELTYHQLKSSREKPLTREELDRINMVTKVSEEDEDRYKNFLEQSNTGIFRLLPNVECETEYTIKLSAKCQNFVPDVWAYSFRLNDYAKEPFQDLSYEEDDLITDGLLSQGILVALGDKSLDDISLNSFGLNFLTSFKTDIDLKTLHKQYRELSEGIERDGLLYTNKLEIKVDNTYAFRIIAYKYKDDWFSRFRGKNDGKNTREDIDFYKIDYDKRNDSVYVFRIIRKSDDGGITILWKRLSKQKSPRIIYRKNEKLKDFKVEK